MLFRATEPPCHRALADARATVDVLHGLFERLGPLGVTTMDELRTFTGAGARRRCGASATWPTACRRRRASTCSATGRAGRSTSARRATSAPGSAPTSRRASRAPAWPRWSASPSGSTRSRAPTPWRPRYASCGSSPSTSRATTVAPASRSARSGSSSPSSPSRGSRRSGSVRDDGAVYLGPLGSRRHGRAGDRRDPRGVPAPAVHRPARRPAATRPPACSPSWVAAAPPATARQSRRSTPSMWTAAKRAWLHDPGELVGRLRRRMTASPRPVATRRRPRTGIGSSRSFAAAARLPAPRRSLTSIGAGRRGARRLGRVGAVGGPPRPPGRLGRRATRCGRPPVPGRAGRDRGDGRARARAAARDDAPRRPSASSGGSTGPACGWWSWTARGPPPPSAPDGSAGCSTCPPAGRQRLSSLDDRRSLRPHQPTRPR